MIGYVTVGSNDIPLAERFYSAFLPTLGYNLDISYEGLSYSLPAASDTQNEPADFYVKPPFDGQPATAGNGNMVAFQVPTQALVRELHANALAAGGLNEGSPGFRTAYSACFYVGYLRDPHSNKIALYCNNRDEPQRPD